MLTKIWNYIQDKSKGILYILIGILAVSSIIRYSEFYCHKNQLPNKVIVENKGPKADYTKDINWVKCNRVQLECVYSNIEKDNAQFVKENCGDVNYCDENY